MNERIRNLAEQAGLALKPRRLYDDTEPDGYLESDLDFLDNNLESTRVFFEGGLEKFAELIVKECAQRCEDIAIKHQVEETTYAAGKKAGAFECAADLKQHFGVEK